MAAPRPFTWKRPDDLATAETLLRSLARRMPRSMKFSTPLRDFVVTRDAGDASGYSWMASTEWAESHRATGTPTRVTVDFQGTVWELTYLVICHQAQHATLTDPHDYTKHAPKRVHDSFNRMLTDGWRAVDPDGLLLATMEAGDALSNVLDSYAVPSTLVEARLGKSRPVAYRALAKLTAMTMPPGDARDVAMQLAETWTGDGKELLVVAKQLAPSS